MEKRLPKTAKHSETVEGSVFAPFICGRKCVVLDLVKQFLHERPVSNSKQTHVEQVAEFSDSLWLGCYGAVDLEQFNAARCHAVQIRASTQRQPSNFRRGAIASQSAKDPLRYPTLD